jgi:tetratricopeptide (TPR) repeat protein
MLEHLHPNIDGYFLLADAFFNVLHEEGFIRPIWNQHLIQPSNYYRYNWGFTELDSLVADLLVKKLMSGWPFQPDTVVNLFRFNYQPVSYLDSMAYMCIKYNDVSVHDQHIALALEYERKGEFYLGYKEYFALIKSNPYESYFYHKAADLLSRSKMPSEAANILSSMPNFRTNYRALVEAGNYHTKAGEKQEAFLCFNLAVKNAKSDEDKESALILLYNAFVRDSKPDEAKKVMAELTRLNPKNKAYENEAGLKIILASKQVKVLLDSSIQLARAGKLHETSVMLEKSLAIEETAFAYSMLGSVFFETDKAKALEYYHKAYALDSFDINVLNNLCVLSTMKRDFKSAKKYLSVLTQLSDDPAYINRLNTMLENAMQSN